MRSVILLKQNNVEATEPIFCLHTVNKKQQDPILTEVEWNHFVK
jgi:hypothetical protein